MPSLPFRIPFCGAEQGGQSDGARERHHFENVLVCLGAHVSHLLLLEVTQGLHHDGAAALLLRVARFQPDDGL